MDIRELVRRSLEVALAEIEKRRDLWPAGARSVDGAVLQLLERQGVAVNRSTIRRWRNGDIDKVPFHAFVALVRAMPGVDGSVDAVFEVASERPTPLAEWRAEVDQRFDAQDAELRAIRVALAKLARPA